MRTYITSPAAGTPLTPVEERLFAGTYDKALHAMRRMAPLYNGPAELLRIALLLTSTTRPTRPIATPAALVRDPIGKRVAELLAAVSFDIPVDAFLGTGSPQSVESEPSKSSGEAISPRDDASGGAFAQPPQPRQLADESGNSGAPPSRPPKKVLE